MKWTIGLAAALLLLSQAGKAQAAGDGERERNSLRLASYNIRNGRGMGNAVDYDRVAAAINRLAADVVAVQEVDSATGRSGGRDLLRELAERTLTHRVYAPAIDFDGGKYGIGILSKEKPLAWRQVPLPGREEARTLLVVEFEKYVYCCVHLSLTEEDRMASLPIIRREAAKAGKPFFIAGDMNAAPESAFIQELRRDFILLTNPERPTFPADKPTGTIDYIAAWKADSAEFGLVANGVWDEPTASDHRPVVADVVLARPQEEIFRMEPYLQNPTDDGMTVMWQTTVPAYGWVEYGTDKEHLRRARATVDGQAVCNGLQNKVRLEGLEPGKTYYYRVCSQEILVYQAYRKVFGRTVVSDFHTFTLPAEDDTDFTALIFNDLHKHSRTLQALYQQVKDVPYDFVVFNGDCIDDPATHEQATRFLRELNETVGASRVPVFYLRGNHEIRNAYSIGLRDLFDYVGGKTYGAFNWGDTRFVMLDCGEDKPDTHWVYYGLNDFAEFRRAQAEFLRDEMASKAFRKAKRRVLIHHIPIYGMGDGYNPCRTEWGGLLAKAPFDICLNAHTHRFNLLPAGEDGNPFPVVVGGGPRLDEAVVMVLEKKGDTLTLRVYDTAGRERLNLNL